jgi:hypothetical protein
MSSETPTDRPPPSAPRSELTGDELDLAVVALALATETDVDRLRGELAEVILQLAQYPMMAPRKLRLELKVIP